MLIAGILGLLVTTSSFNTSGEGIAPGYTVPSLNLENESGKTSIAKMKGSYLMLNFWSASNPQGRINTRLTQTQVQKLKDKLNIKQIAVCTDQSEKMFSAIIKTDNLDPDLQYYVSGKNARQVDNKFNLKKGINSLLINPDGKIIAVNPKPDSLAEKIISDKNTR